MGIRRAEFDSWYEIEALEPRVMLSAEGFGLASVGSETGPRIELAAQEFAMSGTTGAATLAEDAHEFGNDATWFALEEGTASSAASSATTNAGTDGSETGSSTTAVTSEEATQPKAEATEPPRAAFAFASASVAAGVAIFTNTAGGSWSDPANWQDGRVPEAGDDITISGLNSGATVSLNGNTPVLGSLTLDSGTLAITGALNTGNLTVTGSAVLSVGGSGTSAFTGDVSFGPDTSFIMLGTAAVNWTGSTWAQNGFVDLQEDSVLTQQSGVFTLGNTDQFALNRGTLVIAGGEFRVPSGAALNLYHDSGLTISGGTLALSGGTVAAFNESIVDFSAGVITGVGTIRVNNQMTVAGTIQPGEAGTTGTLIFSKGEDAAFGNITFTSAWAIQLDVLTQSNFDVLTLGANVTFGTSGAIAINAANANFSGATEGSALTAALVTVDGTLTREPAVNVTAGSEFSVQATWSGNTLTATVSSDPATPADNGGTVVSEGLTAATSTIQGMLSRFNLGTINFAAQGRPALSLPTLPEALADLFDLEAISASLALPGIGGATTTAEAISALETAGYTVTTPGSGVELRATLTRTIFTDRDTAGSFTGTNFTAPADLLGGVADNLSFAAVLNLAATLLQHVAFELRGGVFHLLSDTYLALALAGGATLSGTVRQGGRTIGAGGSTEVALDVRIVNATGGITATAAGTVNVSLSLTADPVSLAYAHDYTLTRTSDTLVTSNAASSTLSGTLMLPGVTTAAGDPATFALIGAQAGDTWTLTGSGSNVKWLAFSVTGWSFSVTLGPGAFNGSGSITTELDFLDSSVGSAPSVTLGASFDDASITLSGSLSTSHINVVNPAGGTYLSIADFSSNLTVTADLGAGEWTGALTFTGGTSSFNPPGAAFTATLSDSTDADAHAVAGTYDFASKNFTTTVDQFEMVAENIVRVAAAGVTLRHNRDTVTDQELASIANIPVQLLFLTASPSTAPPTATAASIAIRTNGITIGAGSLTLSEASMGSVVQATGVSVSFNQFSFLDGNLSTDNVAFSATSAALFPGNSNGLTASAANLSGTYNFSGGADGRIVLSAASVSFAIGGVSLSASDVTLKPEADVVFSAATLNASISYFAVSGTVTGLEITSAGAASVTSFALDTSTLTQRVRVGGLLPFGFENLEIAFLGDTNGNGTRDAGETFALDAFDVSATGTFDFTVLAALPFTPVIRVGDTTLDDGTDTIAVTFRNVDDAFVPWDCGSIEIGVTNLAVGQSLSIGGTIRLGGYEDGVWVSALGGNLTIAAGPIMGDISGELTAAVNGSLDVASGDLEVEATFVLSFGFGEYVSVTNALVDFELVVNTVGEDASFTLSVTTFGVNADAVDSLSITFGELLAMSATDATFDFTATGEETLLEVGSLTASLTGLGISGTASNFAFRADGLPLPGEGFGVALELGEEGLAGLQWPEWLPLQVTLLALEWDDLTADPLDFTLRLSGTVSSDGLTGSRLTLAGSVSDVAIDLGLLKDGKFPIVGLGSVGIAVGGDIAGSAVSAGLLLGILRVDASGNAIDDADTTTPVAQRVLWGAVRGGVELAGYGGFEIYLGLSQYGPLQGYVKAVVPVVIDVTGLTGLALTNFRAGITFNSELPAITDARDLREHPEFTPTGELSFDEWRGVMVNSLATQVAANAESGAFGILLNPFRLEGGVTIFSAYATQGAFNVDADFMMDSTGKFLALGRFELGGTISFTAGLYFDLSTFVSEGQATILFLAELPAEFPLTTIYGNLRFDFGATVDPENPPAAPFEQFTIVIEGGQEWGIPGIPVFTIEGTALIEVALNAPSLHVTVSGNASIAFLGEVVGVAGDYRFFFGADETVEAVGVIALAPADFALLEEIGLTFDALALLRFNTTNEAYDYTLEIPGQSEPRTFTIEEGEASLLLEGLVGFAPGGTETFRLGGLLSLAWSDEGFDVVVSAELTAGPVAAPLLRFDAQGYLKLVLEGISVGMAAQLELALDPDDDVLAAIGVEVNGSYAFLMNTTGADVDYTLPPQLAAVSTVDRIHLPRGPPSADGTASGAAGSYLIVRASGTLAVLDSIVLQGGFDLTVASGSVEVGFDATLRLGVGEVTFYSYLATGRLRVGAGGIYGQVTLELDAGAGLPEAGLGFSFDATYVLQVNTTGGAQTLDATTTLEAGSYARVRADGALVIGAWRFDGIFDLASGSESIAVAAIGTVGLGVGETMLYTWGFSGTLQIQEDGIFATLALTVNTNGEETFGFGFASGATYTLSLNTTDEALDGVPAGLGARVRVEGALRIGDWSLDGVYDLTATTTGIGFAAATALVMRAGNDELFRVPLNFAIELNIPGIVQDIAVAFSPAELGIAIPGLSLSGAARIVINTTAQQQGDIPAGPLLQFAIEGQAVIGGLTLDGRFAFESAIDRTSMLAQFNVNFGPADAPLLTFTGDGAFDLSLGGIAGYVGLALTGGEQTYRDFFGADVTYFVTANTRTAPYTLGERTLPEGVKFGAEGTVTVVGLELVGTFGLAASAAGVQLDADAKITVKLPTLDGGELTLMSLAAKGGMHLGVSGLVAAFDLTTDTVNLATYGLDVDAASSFRLRINTTDAAQSVAGIDLEKGVYARVEFDAAFHFGVFHLEGTYALQMGDGVAELALTGEMYAQLPDASAKTFRFGAVGGLRIDAQGVAAAFNLDASLLAGTIALDGMDFPVGVEQTFALQLNTTGAARTVNGIVLEAGKYFAVETTGTLLLGPYTLTGSIGFVAADTGFVIRTKSKFGIGVQNAEFMRFGVDGEIALSAAGVFASLTLSSEVGDGFDQYGFGFGAGASFTLAFNTTDSEIDNIPAHSPWALLVSGSLSIGESGVNGGALTGFFRLTPTLDNTLLLHAETNFVLESEGTTLVNVPLVFEQEIEVPGLALRVDLPLPPEDLIIPGLTFDGKFYLQFNATDQPVPDGSGPPIPAGPLFQLVFEGTLRTSWTALTGAFAFEAADGGVRMAAGFTFGIGPNPDAPFATFGGEGVFVVSREGLSGRVAVTIDGGLESVVGPLGAGLTHELRINTRDTEIVIDGVTLAAGPMAELVSTGTLNLVGLAFAGTFRTSGSAAGFSIAANANFELKVPVIGTTLLSIPVVGSFTISDAGFSAALDVTPSTANFEPIGLLFGSDTTYRLRINTTGLARTENGIALEAGKYGRVDVTGTASLGVLVFEGGYSLQAEGDLLRFGVKADAVLELPGEGGPLAGQSLRLGASGQLGIGTDGTVGALDLRAGAGVDRLQLGEIEFPLAVDQAWKLRINTTNSQRVIEGVTLEAGEKFMLETTGGLTIGALRANGLNRFTAGDNNLVRLETDGVLGLINPATGNDSLRWTWRGDVEISSAGIAVHTSLGNPTLQTAFGSMSGTYVLEINTTGTARLGVPANTKHIAINNAQIGIPGAMLRGNASMEFHDGVTLRLDGLTTELAVAGLTGVSFTVNGWMNTAGQFNVSGTASLAVGSRSTVGIFGKAQITLAHDQGIRGAISGGQLYVPGGDYAALNGSFVASATEFSLNVDSTAFVVLGGTVLLRGAFGVTFVNGGFTVSAQNVTAETRIPGFTHSATVNGWLNSHGHFDLNGTLALLLGSKNTAGAFGTLTLNLSHDRGISGRITDGQLYVPGGDYARLNANFRASATEVALEVESTAFRILGGTVLVTGGFRVTLASGVFTILADGVTAEMSVPGFRQSATVSGWFKSDGQFDLSGTSTLALGVEGVAGAFGTLTLSVSHDRGISGRVSNGKLYVPGGDYGALNGNFRASSTKVVLDVENTAFVLLGGTVLLRGGFGVTLAGGVFTIAVKEVTAETRIPGFTHSAKVNGWLNSNGHFDLSGSVALKVGDETLGIDGALTLALSHQHGIGGSINGRYFVPGDYADFSGSLNAGSWGFNVTIDKTAFVLLGGAVRLDGGLRVEMRDGTLTLQVTQMTGRVQMPGFGKSFDLRGWINSKGEFNLDGSTDVDFGNSTLGVKGSSTINVSRSGINGAVKGTFYVPGDWADFSGSLKAGSWGFDVTIDKTAFVLLGGTVRLDGGLRMVMRNGTLTVQILNMAGTLRIPGIEAGGAQAVLNGSINSKGEFDLTGKANFTMGNETVGAEAEVQLRIHRQWHAEKRISVFRTTIVIPAQFVAGISGTASGRAWVLGDWSSFSGRFSANDNGFTLDVKNVRVRVLGSVLLTGSFRLEYTSGNLTLRSDGVRAEVPGIATVTVHGYLNSRGEFDLSGSASIRLGTRSVAAYEGRVDLYLRNGAASMYFTGNIYVLNSHFSKVASWGSISNEAARFRLHADGDFFDIVRYRGWVDVTVEDGGLHIKWDIGAWAWKSSGYTWGSVDTRGGRLSYNVNARLWFEFKLGAGSVKGGAELTFGQSGFYVQSWGKIKHWPFEESLDLELWVSSRGLVSGSFGPIDYEIDFKYGGGDIWLSDVGGSTVFLDANHNGQLDEGEPWTLADENGQFNFAETVVEPPMARTLFETLDIDGDGELSSTEAPLGIMGGAPLTSATEEELATLPVGLSGFTAYNGATVFIDLNGNGAVDPDEPAAVTDESGAYNLFSALNGDTPAEDPAADAGASTTLERLLGTLATYDLDRNGLIDPTEGTLYVVGGRRNDPESVAIQIFRDANGNGVADEGELSVTSDPGQGEALFTIYDRILAGEGGDLGLFATFDSDSDGRISTAERARMTFAQILGPEISTPLPIEGLAAAEPATGYDFVFLDVNGNGAFDAGEPQAFPNSDDEYDFASAPPPAGDSLDPLGRLRPFDTNGNGLIDYAEGVFVVIGGTDNDNGLENPLQITASAAGYGNNSGDTINPLSSLQTALIAQGASPEDAAERVAESLGLGSAAALTSSNPNFTGSDSANRLLGAGAKVNTLVSGGAGLLGDATDASKQQAVFDALASTLASGSLDLSDAASVGRVLQGAAQRVGVNVSESVVAVASSGLATANQLIADTVAAGGDVGRELAAVKAVVHTDVAQTLQGVADGTVDLEAAAGKLNADALKTMIESVELVVSEPPVAGEVEDRIVQGGEVLMVFVPIIDSDTSLSKLRVAVASSDLGLIDTAAAAASAVDGGWLITLPTAAVSAGEATITVSVADATGASEVRFNVKFDGLKPAVRLEQALPRQTLASGQSVELTLADFFADADGNATYAIVPVGQNRTVDVTFANGKLVLTAHSDLSGLAVLDLVASDDHGTARTRFSVVTYPTVEVSERVRFTAPGHVEIDVSLSNPSTQPLALQYQLGLAASGRAPISGKVSFAAGETVKTLKLDLAAIGFGTAAMRELEFGVSGGWTSGAFSVEVNNSNPVELLDLQRRTTLHFEFRLSYLFTDLDNEGEEADGETALFAVHEVVVATVQIATGTMGAAGEGVVATGTSTADLVAAASLATLEQPRPLRGF